MPTSSRTSAGWRSAATSASNSGARLNAIEGGRVHAHREYADAHSPVLPAQPIDVRRDAETQERCRREVPDVSGCVKADHVGAQKPAQQLIAERQRAEHIGRRERDVVKVADGRLGSRSRIMRGTSISW